MVSKVLFSSKKTVVETPSCVFDPLHDEFGFTIDVCATPNNAKVARYFTEAEDGLSQEWQGETCWMNPPYGRTIGLWMKKAYEECKLFGATVVCLVPSRTDTAWWHDYAAKGEVRFIRGRITFVGEKHPAPFPSAIVIFRP